MPVEYIKTSAGARYSAGEIGWATYCCLLVVHVLVGVASVLCMCVSTYEICRCLDFFTKNEGQSTLSFLFYFSGGEVLALHRSQLCSVMRASNKSTAAESGVLAICRYCRSVLAGEL